MQKCNIAFTTLIKTTLIISSTVLINHKINAQIVSTSGAFISISSGTVIGVDTINNDNTSTLANAGTINVLTINNSGTTQGNGTYNIARNFTNTGTFSCGTSIVNYNGSVAQTITALNYYDLTVALNGSRTITATGSIGIANTFSPAASTTSYTTTGSTFNFNGSGAQTIPAFSFNNISVSGGNTKTLGGSINIIGDLTIGANTTLALNSNNITLRSSATATARLTSVPTTAAITYGTGKFIVERYIPGRRKYRLITSSVTTSASTTLTTGQENLSIWGNWQNSGGSAANIGTIITGGTTADGFDQNTTNASLYAYNAATRSLIGFTSANGKNTKYTPLKAGVAYYMFVYGDRTNTVYTNTPSYTTISATGTLLTGDQTYNSSSTIPLSNVAGQYTMLGNPFASPVNWAAFTKTNVANTYWGWDPNLSSTGGYVTVNTTGTVTLISPFTGTTGLDQYIQPGQGFFVQTTASSPVLVIHENDKVSNFNANAFKVTTNNIPLIAVNLYDNTNILTDGALAAFDPAFSNAVGKEDATKMTNAGEVVSISNGKSLLSIDARQMPAENDTIFLNIAKLTKPQYTLQIFSQKINGIKAYLEDKYLKTSHSLSMSDTNKIAFNITADAASFDANRFRIVFGKSDLQQIVTAKTTGLKVFPNPVKDQQIHLQLSGAEKGSYTLRLINAQGQLVQRQLLAYDGITNNIVITLSKKLTSGIYYLQLAGKESYNQNILIE
jgi:hypothetical protein